MLYAASSLSVHLRHTLYATISLFELVTHTMCPLPNCLGWLLGASQSAVLTYYRALHEVPPSHGRRELATRSWGAWRKEILADLRQAHPNIDASLLRLDVRLLGHAMVRPTPGLVWGGARYAKPSSA